MSAREALKAARAAGIEFDVEGDDIRLQAAIRPSSNILNDLSGHKKAVLALLQRTEDGWSGEDWQTFFEERAAIAQFEGGLSLAQAEAEAFDACEVEWLNRNRISSDRGKDCCF